MTSKRYDTYMHVREDGARIKLAATDLRALMAGPHSTASRTGGASRHAQPLHVGRLATSASPAMGVLPRPVRDLRTAHLELSSGCRSEVKNQSSLHLDKRGPENSIASPPRTFG